MSPRLLVVVACLPALALADAVPPLAATRAPVLIDCDSEPEGASLLVDGRDTGRTTPTARLPLPPGPHRFALVRGTSHRVLRVEVKGVEQVLHVRLPAPPADDEVRVILGRDGAAAVDEDAVDDGELIAWLTAARRLAPSLRVVIAADAAVAHGRVVAVMELARRAGLTRISLAVAPAK